MKTSIKIISFLGILITIIACSSTKVTRERINEVTQKIQLKDYTIEANYALPARGRQVYLNYDYNLRISNDSAFAYLPYFGVAYSALYGGGEGGIKFAEPIKEYTITPNKKNDGWDIRFKIDTRDYNYDIIMNVYNNGSAGITVNSFQRSTISFTGNVKGLKAE